MVQYFTFGQVVATRGTVAELKLTDIKQLLEWHGALRQGLLSDADYKLNQAALEDKDRIFSAYEIRGEKYYVITEWDRSCTTIMKPEEY